MWGCVPVPTPRREGQPDPVRRTGSDGLHALLEAQRELMLNRTSGSVKSVPHSSRMRPDMSRVQAQVGGPQQTHAAVLRQDGRGGRLPIGGARSARSRAGSLMPTETAVSGACALTCSTI